VELLWAFRRSASLSDDEKGRVAEKLAARIDSDGMIRVVSGSRRSQLQNRVAAEERLAALLRQALHVAPPRRKTKPTRASREARLQHKKRLSEKKQNRRRDFD